MIRLTPGVKGDNKVPCMFDDPNGGYVSASYADVANRKFLYSESKNEKLIDLIHKMVFAMQCGATSLRTSIVVEEKLERISKIGQDT